MGPLNDYKSAFDLVILSFLNSSFSSQNSLIFRPPEGPAQGVVGGEELLRGVFEPL